MSNIRDEFKSWLQKKKYKLTTINNYISRIDHIGAKLLKKPNKTLSIWDSLEQNPLPILAQYFELANKEYYIDRVTILYAFDYFEKLINFIYYKSTSQIQTQVDLYIFDGIKDYKIHTTDLSNILYVLTILNEMYYQQNTPSLDIKNMDDTVVRLWLVTEQQHFKPEQLKNLALHIVYKEEHFIQTKTALSLFCDCMYSKYQYSYYLYPSNTLINLIQNKNPNKTIDGCFMETRPITGFSARQVEPDIKVRRDIDGEYVYSTADVAEIFNIDFDTASNLMNRFGSTFKIQTVLRGYYSAKATNHCLEEYHHYKDKADYEKYPDVDYNYNGYEWWYNRKEAMKLLGIKKAAFYSHIAKKCLYINYAKGAPKYYAPELEYFKNLEKIKTISKRKYHKNKL